MSSVLASFGKRKPDSEAIMEVGKENIKIGRNVEAFCESSMSSVLQNNAFHATNISVNLYMQK